ncbi:hypothetical protein pipiens_003362 [Culex pipiens pipiens]|uniref:Rna polymerase ii c-terminal domain-binding protein ra4 n=1 Tax=Culex pipiens pipiens TaxID=38569 RepID=A0ABD1CZI3_CULPP
MDTVRIFNQELSGLYEAKPPISKAKMASITRSAMKAIKFYKHVVQSVEKFISKCKSEYKIPGLYVIDSIVRQSRHQFGTEKDVFAPRFARNMEATFAHLFRCPPEDKSKIIRVLNLWQKNMVFAPETIQPLFDLANPEHPIHLQYNASLAAGGGGADQSGTGSNGAGGLNTSAMSHDSPGPMSHDDHHSSGGGGGGGGVGGSQSSDPSKVLDQNTIRQLQQFQQILMRQTSGSASEAAKNQVKFDKKLLAADFDYGSEDEEDKNSPSVPSTTLLPDGGNIAAILSDPNVLKQLQQLQNLQKLKQHEMEEKQSKLTEMRLQEEKFEKHLASVLKKLPFANECDLSRQPAIDLNAGLSSSKDGDGDDFGMVTEVISDTHSSSPRSLPPDNTYKSSTSSRRRKSRSRSRDRGRDRDRGGRSRRSRSRSRSRSHSPRRGGGTSGRGGRGSSRDRERERASQKDKERDKERERERKKRGLPEIRKEHLSVCSTTLWVGHLSKLVQQEELSDTFGKYGDIVSIDLIPPRGCAFIVMNRRQDAHKSMQSLKNHKMHGRTITISWATGKGVKSKEWKDYWDIELGCSYIPWSKVSHATDLEALEEGGMFDDETMPQWLKDKIANKGAQSDPATATAAVAAAAAAASLINPMYPLDTSQPPPPPTMLAAAGMAGLAGFPLVNVPPPNLMMAAAANPPPLPMGAGFGALPPPPPSSNVVNLVSGDEMDIEMEDENSNSNHPLQPPADPSAFFNQPPPPLMPPDFNRNNPMAGLNQQGMDAGGDNNERGGRGNRGNDFDRRGGRGGDRGRRDFDRDGGGNNSRDGPGGRGRRNFRDGSQEGQDRNEPRQSRWGSNDRNRGGGGGGGGSDNGRDDRPLSERLRELAGADFSQRNDGNDQQGPGQQQQFGGRNFRGGRNMNNDGDDFNNRGGDDFGGGRRGGNFQQGGRFQNQRGGRFNNRGGPGGGGGFMHNRQQQQRGGPDGGDMQQGGPINIMSLIFNNEDMPGGMDGANMDPEMIQEQMQQQFFDGGNNNNNNFGNRRGGNNWNDRGNRGRGGNWRDNNDGGDNSDGGGGRGGRFGRRGDQQQRGNQRRNDFGGFGGGDDQQQQQQHQGGRGGQGGGMRWDENDETWDDLPAAKPRGDNRPPPREDNRPPQRDEPVQQKQKPREEPQRDSQDTGILGGGDEWECDAPTRIAPIFSEPARLEEPPSFGGDSAGSGGDSKQDRQEGGNVTPLFDESAPAAAREPEMFRNSSPPPSRVERDPEPEPQRAPSPVPNRPQLYSPSPPPQQAAPEERFEERSFQQDEPPQQEQFQPEPEPQRFEPEPVRESAPEPQHFADEAPPPQADAGPAAAPPSEESGAPPQTDEA